MSFDIIKKNYDRGLWTNAMVKIAVVKKVISEKELWGC